MLGRNRVALAFVAVVLLSIAVVDTGLAYDGFLAPLQEVPVTRQLLSGARAAGMGGAYLAVAEDASAMAWNPAALARLRRIEFSAGILRDAHDRTGSSFGEDYDTSVSQTTFSSFRLAYPFPTFRGSLVLGVSGDRVLNFGDDFLSSYRDTITWWEETQEQYLTAVWDQTEDYITEGGMYAWSFGAAIDASPKVSLGASLSYWTGNYGRHFMWDVTDTGDESADYDSYLLSVDEDAEVSGFRAKLGGLFYLTDGLSAALVIDSPITLTFDTVSHSEQQWVGPEGGVADTTEYFIDEITLPFSFAGGVAYAPTEWVMLAADVRFTDWSELNYEGPFYLGDPAERERAFDATTDVHLGVEFTIPTWPLRLRGGYMSRPTAYQALNIDKDRSYFSVGAGVLIDTVLTIDVALVTGAIERSGVGYDYDETIDEAAFLLEAAYRF